VAEVQAASVVVLKMAEPVVIGIVDYVEFHPGRPQQLSLQIRAVPIIGGLGSRHFLDWGGRVYWNGSKLEGEASVLLFKLAEIKGKRVQVTLHPDPQRYGGSINAEFVEVE
jgi:hypothetical protein